MARYPIPQVDDTDVVQVVVHGALFPRLAQWLDDRDFRLQEVEVSPEEGSMRTFVITFGEGRAAALKAVEQVMEVPDIRIDEMEGRG